MIKKDAWDVSEPESDRAPRVPETESSLVHVLLSNKGCACVPLCVPLMFIMLRDRSPVNSSDSQRVTK
jgi:hypothetical protein